MYTLTSLSLLFFCLFSLSMLANEKPSCSADYLAVHVSIVLGFTCTWELAQMVSPDSQR